MPGTTTYIKEFTDTLDVHIRGTDHGFHRSTMTVEIVAAYRSSDGTRVRLVPYFAAHLWYSIDPLTQDLHVRLPNNKYAGLVRLTAEAV